MNGEIGDEAQCLLQSALQFIKLVSYGQCTSTRSSSFASLASKELHIYLEKRPFVLGRLITSQSQNNRSSFGNSSRDSGQWPLVRSQLPSHCPIG